MAMEPEKSSSPLYKYYHRFMTVACNSESKYMINDDWKIKRTKLEVGANYFDDSVSLQYHAAILKRTPTTLLTDYRYSILILYRCGVGKSKACS